MIHAGGGRGLTSQMFRNSIFSLLCYTRTPRRVEETKYAHFLFAKKKIKSAEISP